MKDYEKQILENQRRIMDFLLNPHSPITKNDLICSINNTARLYLTKKGEKYLKN